MCWTNIKPTVQWWLKPDERKIKKKNSVQWDDMNDIKCKETVKNIKIQFLKKDKKDF